MLRKLLGGKRKKTEKRKSRILLEAMLIILHEKQTKQKKMSWNEMHNIAIFM